MNPQHLFYRLTVILLTGTLLLSGTVLARGLADSLYQKRSSEALAARVADARPPLQPTAPIPPENRSTSPTEPTVLPEYAALFEENPDLVGWLTVEGTKINYPVMQTPDRPDHYLYRNFKQEQSAHGCLYVRESCDVFAPSDNLTVYGHHMRDGTMFAPLDRYRKEDFRDQHPTVRFDTLYERHTYTVFAVFTTTSTEEGFAYHLFETAAEESEFDAFVSTCKALSLYDTGITPRYGDKLLCLSTCEYSRPNGRLVVAAFRHDTSNLSLSPPPPSCSAPPILPLSGEVAKIFDF